MIVRPTLREVRAGIVPVVGGLAAAVALSACANKPVETKPPAPATAAPAPAPVVAGGSMKSTTAAPAPAPLTGHVTRAALEEYPTWRALRAQDYPVDSEAVGRIAERRAGVDVLAIVATWCGDSKREVPRFFKIADQAGLPLERTTLVAVDRTKKDAEGLTEKHGITRVPTFVFFREGKEIGRVTERPTTTLENDIAQILR